MALINCSDCNAEVSDSAHACLRCGRRIVSDKRRQWELGAVIASLIGLLALVVSGYTAWIQREQVRAQVWPNLIVGYDDQKHLLAVLNKGVGPAQVRSVQVFVDGKPQLDWRHTLDTLGLSDPVFGQSSLTDNVLSPNETLNFMTLESAQDYERFRQEASSRFELEICFCSTLNECWLHRGQNIAAASVRPVAACKTTDAVTWFKD